MRKPNRPRQPQNQTRPEEEEEEVGEQTKIIIMMQKSKNPEILPQNRKKNTHKRSTEFSASTAPYLRTISEPPPAIPRLRSRSLSLFSPTLLAQQTTGEAFSCMRNPTVKEAKLSLRRQESTTRDSTRLEEAYVNNVKKKGRVTQKKRSVAWTSVCLSVCLSFGNVSGNSSDRKLRTLCCCRF